MNKGIVFGIMAFLLVGSVMGAMLPKDVIDITPKPHIEPEQVQVVVEESHKSNDARQSDECNFDVKNPRCFVGLWDKEVKLVINENEIPFEYDFRSNKNQIKVGNDLINLVEMGAFRVGYFEKDNKLFKFSKGGGSRYTIREV